MKNLEFLPWRKIDPKAMSLARPLLGTTNEGQILGFHPGNHSSVLEKHHQNVAAPSYQGRCFKSSTPDTQEKHVLQVQHNQNS
jgi:hypothetical protein